MAKTELAKPPKKSVRKVVTIRTRIGEAREVVLTGEFTGWAKDKLRLTKGADGDWTGSIDLAPGEYQYRLVVDGEWRDDPSAQARVPNDFGTTNCVLKVS
jgi:hypothetical protein